MAIDAVAILRTSAVFKRAFLQVNQGVFNESFSESLAKAIADHMVTVRNDFPDIQYDVTSAVEKGNVVAFQYSASGTHASTGRKLSWTGSGHAQIVNGKIVHLRATEDSLARQIQLGEVPRVGFGGLTGKWRTKVQGLLVDLNVNEDADGLWGTADIENVGPATFTGVRTSLNGSVKLTIVFPDGNKADFTGNLMDDRNIEVPIAELNETVRLARR